MRTGNRVRNKALQDRRGTKVSPSDPNEAQNQMNNAWVETSRSQLRLESMHGVAEAR